MKVHYCITGHIEQRDAVFVSVARAFPQEFAHSLQHVAREERREAASAEEARTLLYQAVAVIAAELSAGGHSVDDVEIF